MITIAYIIHSHPSMYLEYTNAIRSRVNVLSKISSSWIITKKKEKEKTSERQHAREREKFKRSMSLKHTAPSVCRCTVSLSCYRYTATTFLCVCVRIEWRKQKIHSKLYSRSLILSSGSISQPFYLCMRAYVAVFFSSLPLLCVCACVALIQLESCLSENSCVHAPHSNHFINSSVSSDLYVQHVSTIIQNKVFFVKIFIGYICIICIVFLICLFLILSI